MFTILIVDDEWTIREGLKRTVPWESWGIEVNSTASNGEEALQKLAKHHVDILLTDIRMPGISGLELIEFCKKKYPALKIIILTGHDEFGYAQQAIKLGADDFLLKPTNIDELEKSIVKIKNELQEIKIEDEKLISFLIKDLLDNHTLENINKLNEFNSIHGNFGLIIIRSESEISFKLKLQNIILVENKNNTHIYFCHNIEDENDWDSIINDVKESTGNCILNIYVSLLTGDLNDLLTIYTQAKAASSVYYKNNSLTIFKYIDDKYTVAFEKILLYINQHYNESISQAELATQLHMSNSYFSKLFKQHTGMNFVEYITVKRMEVAKELLKSTTLKTYEVANEVGYVEARYFSQIFKKSFGCTPQEYRMIDMDELNGK